MTIEDKGYSVRVEKHSLHPYGGPPLTTLVCRYPRFIHAQVLTHRAFSRNAASNRALPFETVVKEVQDDPVVPLAWQADKRGMKGGEELNDIERAMAIKRWDYAVIDAVHNARTLHEIGAHHQIVNRLLEPFQWITTIITATEWDNFFALRCADDAQPEIQHLACLMRDAVYNAEPTPAHPYQFHTPFSMEGEWESDDLDSLLFSVGRCARVSYLQHDGTRDSARDKALALRLLKNGHWSPFEHVAAPDAIGREGWISPEAHANLVGWVPLRHSMTLRKIAEDNGVVMGMGVQQ